jgi:hypothetical protein
MNEEDTIPEVNGDKVFLVRDIGIPEINGNSRGHCLRQHEAEM